jgi:hypothetical protein
MADHKRSTALYIKICGYKVLLEFTKITSFFFWHAEWIEAATRDRPCPSIVHLTQEVDFVQRCLLRTVGLFIAAAVFVNFVSTIGPL